MSLMMAHPCFGPSARLDRINSSGSEAGPVLGLRAIVVITIYQKAMFRILLSAGLQLVVPELLAGFRERLALADRGADLLLDRVDLLGSGQHRVLVRLRKHDHAVRITAHEIAGVHPRIADVHDRI